MGGGDGRQRHRGASGHAADDKGEIDLAQLVRREEAERAGAPKKTGSGGAPGELATERGSAGGGDPLVRGAPGGGKTRRSEPGDCGEPQGGEARRPAPEHEDDNERVKDADAEHDRKLA